MFISTLPNYMPSWDVIGELPWNGYCQLYVHIINFIATNFLPVLLKAYNHSEFKLHIQENPQNKPYDFVSYNEKRGRQG